MVAIRRINPEDGFVRVFKELKDQVHSQGTRASGEIVIRESLSTTDPATGVSVVIGRLPDGSTGMQEFVNDVTPPGKPTAPTTTPSLGAVSLQWDGFQIGGDPQPKDYDRTEIKYRKTGTIDTWQLGGVFYGASTLVVPALTARVTYDFQLVSYDKNGNASSPSDTVTGTAAAIIDNSDVADALQEVREEAAKAGEDSAAAQGAAKAAQDAADKAARDAASFVAGASRTIFSDTAPTDPADRNKSTLWIDISGNPPKNTPNRWDGTKWIVITDKKAVDAAEAAGRAESKADTAAASAAAAALAAGDAQASANGSNRNWFLSTPPAGNAHKEGDTWFDTANGNAPMVWSKGAWVSARDKSIATAQSKANEAASAASSAEAAASAASGAAQNAADAAGAKGKVLVQSAAPSTADQLPQNLWINTTNNANTPMRWNTTSKKWEVITDKVAVDAASKAVAAEERANLAFNNAATAAESAGLAQQSANGKNRVWYSATKPTGTDHGVNDIWYDSANGNRPMRWTGSDWLSVQDQVYKAIETTVERVTASANGKNTIYYSGTAPVSTTDKPLATGDTWFDTANGNRIKVWSGGKWNDAVDKAVTDANTAASAARSVADGKNTTYYQNSAPVATTTKALIKGDTWFDTANNYALWTHTGTAWQKVQDAATAKAEAVSLAATDATNKANAAKADALAAAATAAAANAKSQVEAAEARVALVASNDAKAKADAAQAAALSAAKTYADAQASGAQGAALEAAKLDATQKADAAKKAAIDAAALDATAKRELAESNAAADAKTKADKALADAKVDATAKANAAQNAALLVANAKNKSSTGATAPASPVPGDIWVDTANGNVIKVYSTSGWTSYQDKAIAAVETIAEGALSSANGKNIITYSTAAPTVANGTGRISGDTWFRQNAAGNLIGQWTWDGAKWVVTQINHEVIASIDADKISTGTMDAKYITANTITTDQLMVGFGTNLIPNPGFELSEAPHKGYATAVTASWSTVTPHSGTRSMIVAFPSITAGTFSSTYTMSSGVKSSNGVANNFNIDPNKNYQASFWAKSSGTAVSGHKVRIAAYFYTSAGVSAGVKNSVETTLSTAWGQHEWNIDKSLIPATATSVLLAIQTNQTASVQIDDLFFGEKIDGSLLVKGSITADLGILGEAVVGTAEIEEAAITTAKIDDLAVTDAKIGSLHAGKIDAGELDAARIGAKTIGVEQLLVSSTDNLISDADFTDPKGVAWGKYSGAYVWNETGGRNGGPAMKIVNTNAQQGKYNLPDAPTSQGHAYRVGAWIKSTVAIPSKGVALYCRQKTNKGNTYTTSQVWTNDGLEGRSGALAANTWHWISDIFTTVTDATTMAFGIFSQATFTTGELSVDFVSVTRAANGSLVVDGSITSDSVTTTGLDAGVIKFGTMDGERISANTIDASKLLIGANDNLVNNPAMIGHRGWGNPSAGSGSGYSSSVVYPGMSESMMMTQYPAGQSNMTLYGPVGNLIPVTFGEAFFFSIDAYVTGASDMTSISNQVYFYNSSKALLSGSTGNQVGGRIAPAGVTYNTWMNMSAQLKVPQGAVYMAIRPTVYFGASSVPTSAVFYYANPRVLRATGTTLIEDGAVTTDHMTAGTIDGKIITGGTIKGTQIEAKTISTDNLLITSTDNLIQEADFGAKGIGWTLIGTTAVNNTAGRNGGPALRFTAASGVQTVYNKYTASVEPGNVYRLTAWVKPSVALAANTFTFMAVSSTAANAKTYLKTYAPAIAAGAWGQVTGVVTVPDTSKTLQFALELPATVTSGTVDVDFASATRASDGELIVEGSITTKSMKSGTIDAAVLSAGTVTGAHIAGQTITAEKMIIGQGVNLITDPAFMNAASNTIRASKSTGTWTFQYDSGSGVMGAKTTTATTNNAFMFGVVSRSAANAANMIPASPGEKYVFLASVYTNISAGVRWNVETVKADGTVGYVSASPTNTATGRRDIPAYEYTIPAGVVAFNPVLACLTTGVTWVVDGGAVVARKVEGNLIVDGALTGKTITGAIIQSRDAEGLGIKLTDTQFVAYNAAKAETFRIDGATGNVTLKGTIKSGSLIEGATITGATITGGVVQTAASGKKIIIQNQTYGSDVRFYSPNNSSYAQMLYGTTEENTSGGTAGSDMLTIKGDQTGKAYMILQGTGGITIDASETLLMQASHNVDLLTGSENPNAAILADGKMVSLMHNEFSINNQLVPANTIWGPGKPTYDAGWSRIESSLRDRNGAIYTRVATNRGANPANTYSTMCTWVENDVLQVHYAGLYVLNWSLILGTPHPSSAYAYIARSNEARICGVDFKGGLVNISHPAVRIGSGEKIKFKFSTNTQGYFTHDIQISRLA